ncbi:uncharacterized protein EAF02_011949 [Botrytis sinoallii]|uniref:uncharacterized protein n=1 Tax=Botrytis sinoallii TaxID=1463999 RepID=UPI0018FF446F|nr:uncharacterized protein EAF02_011949 [Botrytis sinoallii]KAF7853295.1 hypothetical protein EAF02_011949 [Botrytis sinoallii]
MLDDDIIALHDLQNNSEWQSCRNLRFCAGIRGIEFIYNTGIRSTWGSDYDTASLSFFLQEFEYLGRIMVYNINSVVYHLQQEIWFITDLNRTSEFMPPAPTKSGVSFDCVEYSPLDNGYIVGLCEIRAAVKMFRYYIIHNCGVFEINLDLLSGLRWLWIPVSGRDSRRWRESWRDHSFDKILSPPRSHRSSFLSLDGSYPELLGQLTEMGQTYHFEVDEWIIDLEIITIKSCVFAGWSHELSQVKKITIAKNQRRMELRPEIVQIAYDVSNTQLHKRRVSEITWEFNAMYDRVQWNYQEDRIHKAN